jgi:hypothetical protein
MFGVVLLAGAAGAVLGDNVAYWGEPDRGRLSLGCSARRSGGNESGALRQR